MIDASKTNRLTTLPTTVLFVDIVDSIDLFARLGNEAAKDLIDEFFEQLRFLVIDHHGTVVKRIGDELMCSFNQPLAAFAAARDMQRLADTLNGTRPEQVKLRIGFHSGNVIRAGDDLFGDTVNIASRVAAVASSGRILTTGQTMGMVPAFDAGLVRPWRRELLKGLSEPVELHEVMWTDDVPDDGFRNTSLGSYQPPVLHQLVMHLQGHVHVVDAQRPLLTIGRHPSNQVVVADDAAFVSSHHAKIECRGGVFVITDTSLNGTYVALGGSDYFRIKLPFTLESSGQLVLGYPPQHPNQILARFELL
jgi:class 3 adenylate cyclase